MQSARDFSPFKLGSQRSSVSRNARVAAGKALSFFRKVDKVGYCDVERTSVYGVAITMPQVARSVGWSTTISALAARAIMLLLLNYIMQFAVLSFVNEVAHVMNPYKGQMHLCDFGASIIQCPSSPDCRGPGGTTFALPRLYGFNTWSTRSFVRDTLKALFPERAQDIDMAADPGEYGLEDYYCRLLCCLLFTMEVVGEFFRTCSLANLLYQLPSQGEDWLYYEVPEWVGQEQARNKVDFDFVKFRIAGMPLTWKAFNVLIIFLPKAYLWTITVTSGFHFLMETAGIMDLVVNSMALSFVLSIDELLFDRLGTGAGHVIMERLESYPLFDLMADESNTDAEVEEWLDKEEFTRRTRMVFAIIFEKRLIVIFVIMGLLSLRYYHINCKELADGSWVSQDIYVPRRMSYNPVSFIHSVFLDISTEPVWSWPPEN